MPSWGPEGAPPPGVPDELEGRKPPAISPEATAIVEGFRSTFSEYFDAINGRVKSIHQSINQIATANGKPPLPPQAIGALLELTREQMQQPGGPVVTLEQMMKAFSKMVNLQEPKEKFEAKVVSVLAAEVVRLKHAATVTAAVKPDLIRLHEKVAGATGGLFALVKELMPEDARADFPQHAFCTHLMQVPPDTAVIPLEVFLEQFQANLDTDDTEDKIRAALARHI